MKLLFLFKKEAFFFEDAGESEADRTRRRPGFFQQIPKQQPVARAFCLVDIFSKTGDSLVEFLFLLTGIDLDGLSESWRYIKPCQCPGISDHHLTKKFFELASVLRVCRVPARHELLAKFRGCLELARL